LQDGGVSWFLLTKITSFHPHDTVSATISSTLFHGSSGNCSRAILEGIAVDMPVVARDLNGRWVEDGARLGDEDVDEAVGVEEDIVDEMELVVPGVELPAFDVDD